MADNQESVSCYSTIKDAALAYVRQGKLAVIPLRGKYGSDYNNAKMPMLKSWQRVQPDETLVSKWFEQKPGIDIGLLCGKANGIFVLDADKEIGLATAESLNLPETVVNVTPKGRQYLFRWDVRLDGIPTNLVKPFSSLPGIDFRGENGFIVAPPSQNLGDVQYHWLNEVSIEATRLAPIPEWLIQLFLERATVGDEVANTKSVNMENWFEEIKDGVAEGENRHKAMTRLTSFYMSRGLPEDDVVTLMTLWNQKCSPPKPDEEFLLKLDQFLENWREGGAYKSNYKQVVTSFALQTSADFVKGTGDVNVSWIAEGLIPEETITFLHAYGGVGKSWFALDLAIEVGRGGGNWMEHFPTSGGRVLYVDEELHPKLLRQRYNKLLKGKGLESKDVDISFLSLQQLRLDLPASVEAFKGLLVEFKPDLVVLDPFVVTHRLNENSVEDMSKMRSVFKDLIKTCSTGFLVVDHETKPSAVIQSAAQRQRGSSEKDALADVKIALSKDANGQIVVEHAKARWTASIPTFKAEIADPLPGESVAIKYLGLVE